MIRVAQKLVRPIPAVTLVLALSLANTGVARAQYYVDSYGMFNGGVVSSAAWTFSPETVSFYPAAASYAGDYGMNGAASFYPAAASYAADYGTGASSFYPAAAGVAGGYPPAVNYPYVQADPGYGSTMGGYGGGSPYGYGNGYGYGPAGIGFVGGVPGNNMLGGQRIIANNGNQPVFRARPLARRRAMRVR